MVLVRRVTTAGGPYVEVQQYWPKWFMSHHTVVSIDRCLSIQVVLKTGSTVYAHKKVKHTNKIQADILYIMKPLQ